MPKSHLVMGLHLLVGVFCSVDCGNMQQRGCLPKFLLSLKCERDLK
jgi:hypothetical protein